MGEHCGLTDAIKRLHSSTGRKMFFLMVEECYRDVTPIVRAGPENLLEGTGKGVRQVKLRGIDDVKRPGVKKLIAEAAKLNKKDPHRECWWECGRESAKLI